MKVIIAGSRTIKKYNIQAAVDRSEFLISEVVCGMSKGIDRIGYWWARVNKITIEPFYADWYDEDNLYDPSAGPRRNKKMARYADALILIWDGKSKGSTSMLEEAEKRGLKIYQEIIDIP